jgi:hypothetical protein
MKKTFFAAVLLLALLASCTEDTEARVGRGNYIGITTTVVSGITRTGANSGGTVTSGGAEDIRANGVCWATTNNPTINNFKTTNGATTGSYTSVLTNLTPNTTYYLRAYVTIPDRTVYGNVRTFRTLN